MQSVTLLTGHPSAMTRLRDEFPSSGIYLSEGSVYGVSGAQSIIK
jgi:hypothetical protein